MTSSDVDDVHITKGCSVVTLQPSLKPVEAKGVFQAGYNTRA